jgi:hypothetical protein
MNKQPEFDPEYIRGIVRLTWNYHPVDRIELLLDLTKEYGKKAVAIIVDECKKLTKAEKQ